jgi:hypothetical protein
MRSSVLLLVTVFLSGALLQSAGQGMAASQPPATASIGKITAASVWQPPQDFVTKAQNLCSKSMTAMTFPECFMNQIAAAGASPEAVAFTRALYQQSDGQVGIMSAFREGGSVSLAQVFYPLRANDNYGLLLVNGHPQMLDVDNLRMLDKGALQQDPTYQSLKKAYPQLDIWPGDRSGSNPWPDMQAPAGGGSEFVVSYPLINGCHACERVGTARFGWDFDASGKFLKPILIDVQGAQRRTSQ